MIEINGKVYRNLQEQVKKNQEDIAVLQQEHPVPEDVYSKEESDARYYTKTQSDNTFTTRAQVEGIISTKTANFLEKATYFDDEDNPQDYHIKMPRMFNDSLSMEAHEDDNNHPCDAGVYVFPTRIVMEANDYNHGPDDDTYSASIEITDSSVHASKLDPTDWSVKSYELTRYSVKHDMLFYVVDNNLHYGVVHMIFTDNYDYPYDYAKIFRDWRSYIYPEVYYRSCNSQTLSNLGGDRIYPSFYLDNTDELWFEEQDDFYSGSQYTEESANSYHVLACNDKITKF